MLARIALLIACAAGIAAAPQKIFPYPYSQEDLPNGLRLITVPTEFPNIVTVYIVVQTGSRNEVLLRGTPNYSPEKYTQTLNSSPHPMERRLWTSASGLVARILSPICFADLALTPA